MGAILAWHHIAYLLCCLMGYGIIELAIKYIYGDEQVLSPKSLFLDQLAEEIELKNC
ncbi:hypothetical protein SAMN05444266_106531 [Chitinophaga jiangningensis]|uniref:Uncharacterized protein n=1 Tax=Chitinophaga jiangningensis TaxID=1419482 RepID=A0A1M7GF34_9BACT|nr:hypothetical protein SAMN05444266_106531 [Chitinophaga jiangningensis]